MTLGFCAARHALIDPKIVTKVSLKNKLPLRRYAKTLIKKYNNPSRNALFLRLRRRLPNVIVVLDGLGRRLARARHQREEDGSEAEAGGADDANHGPFVSSAAGSRDRRAKHLLVLNDATTGGLSLRSRRLFAVLSGLHARKHAGGRACSHGAEDCERCHDVDLFNVYKREMLFLCVYLV